MCVLCGSGRSPSKTGMAHCMNRVKEVKMSQAAPPTCNISLQSWAVIFFSSDLFDLIFLMPSIPKIGISRNLMGYRQSIDEIFNRCSPLIKLMFECRIPAVQNTQQMDENHLPNTELNFVHQIYNEHTKHVKPEGRQLFQKCVLTQ